MLDLGGDRSALRWSGYWWLGEFWAAQSMAVHGTIPTATGPHNSLLRPGATLVCLRRDSVREAGTCSERERLRIVSLNLIAGNIEPSALSNHLYFFSQSTTSSFTQNSPCQQERSIQLVTWKRMGRRATYGFCYMARCTMWASSTSTTREYSSYQQHAASSSLTENQND